MFRDLSESGPMPVLAAMLRFSAQRQGMITDNIANLDTPDARQRDVSPRAFQRALREAVSKRRESGQEAAPLGPVRGPGFAIGNDGTLRLDPVETSAAGGVLYHDRNNRDMEGLMQDLAENGMAFRLASDLMRRHNDMLRVAITQRV